MREVVNTPCSIRLYNSDATGLFDRKLLCSGHQLHLDVSNLGLRYRKVNVRSWPSVGEITDDGSFMRFKQPVQGLLIIRADSSRILVAKIVGQDLVNLCWAVGAHEMKSSFVPVASHLRCYVELEIFVQFQRLLQ